MGGREGMFLLCVGDVLYFMLIKLVCWFSLSCELFIEVGFFFIFYNVFFVLFNICDGFSFLMIWDGDYVGIGKVVVVLMSVCFLLL